MADTTTVTEDCQSLRELREKRDAAKSEYDDLKESYDLAERDLLERMELEEVDGHKTDGINFVPVKTTYGQVQDREEFVAWAEDHDEGLIEMRERKSNLNELVRERLDNGEPLPPGLGFYVKEYVSQRAA